MTEGDLLASKYKALMKVADKFYTATASRASLRTDNGSNQDLAAERTKRCSPLRRKGMAGR
jgi:hypothetical protein